MKKSTKRKDPSRYVVGYGGTTDDVVYGPDEKGKAMYCGKMTLPAAKHRLRGMLSAITMRVIYKLVPVFVLQPGQVMGKRRRKRG